MEPAAARDVVLHVELEQPHRLREAGSDESRVEVCSIADGHDILHLTEILRDLKDIQGPKLLHVKTKKGKGFAQAEENQTAFHSPGKFDRETGQILSLSKTEKKPPR